MASDHDLLIRDRAILSEGEVVSVGYLDRKFMMCGGQSKRQMLSLSDLINCQDAKMS